MGGHTYFRYLTDDGRRRADEQAAHPLRTQHDGAPGGGREGQKGAVGVPSGARARRAGRRRRKATGLGVSSNGVPHKDRLS